jgi:hypothetical protein
MNRLARSLLPALAVLAALASASDARADEIRYYDPATGELKTEKVQEVTDESWTFVTYRPGANKPLKKVETRLVTEIRRAGDDAQLGVFRAAEDELARGNYAAAMKGFADVGGGGMFRDDQDKTAFRPFPSDAKAKWYAGYAQFLWAKAAYLQGREKADAILLQSALRALDTDSAAEKGFLQRFKEGKNRYYADALALKGDLLLALSRPAEAAAAWEELYQKSISLPIGARWSFEAKVGAGKIAEAKGSTTEAESAYEAAASALQSLLEQAPDAPARRALGRYWAEARVQKARVMLHAAEKADSPPEYARLRGFLQEGTPDAIRQKFAGKSAEVVEAVVAGALSPTVQAIVSNGIGLSYLSEKKYVEALFAFSEVRIKHFSVREEVPRALYYLAKAATAAAAAATKPDAKVLFTQQADVARKELQTAWKDSPWASRK